jgi:osmotically-inducible protein OsmY
MDEREELDRMDRERRYGRYRRDDYSASDYGSSDYGERSFQPRDRDRDRDHDRDRERHVFGERESGVNYTTGANYGPPRYGRDRNRGGRFYGDDGRERIYREEYRPSSVIRGGPQAYGAGRYGESRYSEGRWRNDDEHAYRVAYGDRHPEHSGHYEGRESGRDDDRNFWERASDRVASWFGEGDYDERRDRGEHRGRGPSGYKRADDRINEEAHERLTDDPWVDASAITIAVAQGEITLSGTVPERESKHRAERIVESLTGVTHVQNNLRVQRNPLTEPGRGFGDSAQAAQMNETPKTPRTN